jgi:hypothetical protein
MCQRIDLDNQCAIDGRKHDDRKVTDQYNRRPKCESMAQGSR